MDTLRRRHLLLGLATMGGLGGLPPAHADEERAPPLPAVGSALVLPEVPLLDGGTFLPVQAEGQVLVLYWWASWCPFCAQQSPLIDEFWRTHRERGLRLVGLTIDRKPEDASAYLAKRGYVFPAAMVTPPISVFAP